MSELIYKGTDCPILILEADSYVFFHKKELIKKYIDRILIAVFHPNRVTFLQKEYRLKDKIIILPCSTRLQPESVEKDINISFIGTLGVVDNNSLVVNLAKNVHDGKFLSKAKSIFDKALYNFDDVKPSDLETLRCSQHELFWYLSTYTRVAFLDAVAPLGLACYGQFLGLERMSSFYDLFFCLRSELVLSMQENQDIYNRSKVSINLHFPQNSRQKELSVYSWRVPDIMATNACLASVECHALKRDFGKWVQIPQFSNKIEAYEICKKLLDNESLRQDIVWRSQLAIKEGGFTFNKRILELEQLFSLKPQPKSSTGYMKYINVLDPSLVPPAIEEPNDTAPQKPSRLKQILRAIYTVNLQKIAQKLNLEDSLRRLVSSGLGKWLE
ncbi:MAG: hypothetical protein ACK4QL_05940 [Pseudanabaenaceae cyanobacterium]